MSCFSVIFSVWNAGSLSVDDLTADFGFIKRRET